MPTTGPQAYPYPNGTDVPDGPAAFLALGQRLAVTTPANVADLDGLAPYSATAYESQIIHVDELNTNVQAMDGVWVQTGPASFGTAAARDAAYAKASGAYRIAGVTCVITSQPLVLMECNGFGINSQGWQKRGLIKPSAVATSGGSHVINDDGSVTITFTGAGTSILSNTYPPLSGAYGTDEYETTISQANGGAAQINVRMCTGGSADPSGANHDMFGTGYIQAGTAVSPYNTLNAVSWIITGGGTAIQSDTTLLVRHANEARQTNVEARFHYVTTVGTNQTGAVATLDHRLTTLFDGLQIIATAACVVTVKNKPRP